MKDLEEEILGKSTHSGSKQPLVLRVTDADFQQDVLSKLGRLEALMEMLVGGTQPGRMKMAEDKINALEKNDIRRGVYDRLINAAITVAISAAIAMHDHLGFK